MTLDSSTLPSRSSLVKWFLFILTTKFLWLFLFTFLRNPEWNPAFLARTFGLYGGDSLTYYYPVDQLIKTGQYYGMCRMPGVLPVYFPLRLFLSEVQAHEVIVFLQLIFDSIATLLLALIALHVFKSKRAFAATILISCATCFVALRNSYLLSDSFCVSSLITSFYFLSNYFNSTQKKHLLYAGIFLSWSIFLRQITILAIPVMATMVIVYHRKQFRKTFYAGLFLSIPVALSLGAWTLRNTITFHRPIVLVAPLEECMFNLTPELAAIRALIIGMGEDFQPWSKGGGAYWFFNQPLNDPLPCPFHEYQYTTGMKEADLFQLRADYRAISAPSNSSEVHDSLQQSVVLRANRFLIDYKSEHAFQFHVGNKLRFAGLFLFPGRIDDIPFPAMDKMNFLQKGIKAWSLVSLWLVHACALLVLLWWILKREKTKLLWALLPFSFILALSYLGYIEQRYLATSYPFFILLIAGSIAKLKREVSLSAPLH
jgi:hypothetical protein